MTCPALLEAPTALSQGRFLRAFQDSGRWGVLGFLAILLAVRVLYLAICPLELVPDEAYYWDWSRQLDWSYYSKPPMIAWLIACATSIGGESEFAIRLPATILGTAGLWLVYELGRSMYDHRIGLWTCLIVAASPGMTALCLLMTIDAPFLVLWTASLCCLWRMFEADEPKLTWLLPAILSTGLGLLTKQSTIGLLPLVGLFLLTSRSNRRYTSSTAAWLWAGGSLMFLLPVLWWNHQHAWVTLEHTSQHFGSQPVSALRHLTRSLEFVLSQFGILSPVICWMATVVGLLLSTTFSRLEKREQFLICFGAIPLAGVTLLSLFQKIQPNWAVALHLSGIVLLAAWGCGTISLSTRLDAWRRWLPAGIAVSAALSFGVALIPFAMPSSVAAGTNFDPTVRLRGWRDMGQQVSAMLQSLPANDQVLLIAATSRGPVSELAYYLPGKPRVYRWNVGQVIDSQHDVWSGPADAHGRDALIITDGNANVPDRLARSFQSVHEVGPVVVTLGPHKQRRYRVWRGEAFDAWPDRLSQVPPFALPTDSSPIISRMP